MSLKIAFCASNAAIAQSALEGLTRRYGNHAENGADVIVALGGDGFMLHTLHRTEELAVPVYGMNRGTVGFLMNAYSEHALEERLAAAEEEVVNPLATRTMDDSGTVHEALAINEVSLLRETRQAAKVLIKVDDRVLSNGAPGPLSMRLHSLYWAKRAAGWLGTPVNEVLDRRAVA